MQIPPLEFQILKILTNESKLKKFDLPKTSFWAKVKSFMHSDVVLDLEGKEILVKNQASLKLGEKIFLLPKQTKDKLELEILERILEKNNFQTRPLSRIEENMESFLASKNINSPDVLLSLIQTLFPVLDWKEDVKYFYWNWKEGEAQGYLGEKEQEKLFLLRVQRPILGNLEIIFSWKEPTASKMRLEMRFGNLFAYLGFLSKESEILSSFEALGIQLESLVFRLITESYPKGWVV